MQKRESLSNGIDGERQEEREFSSLSTSKRLQAGVETHSSISYHGYQVGGSLLSAVCESAFGFCLVMRASLRGVDVSFVEEQMRDRWSGLLLCLVLCAAPQLCYAEEIAGMLMRVDRHTVTVRRNNDQKVVMYVENGQRREAAPYLGKWVMVDFRHERGSCRVLRFRPPR